jgi:membrane-anchored glycerophosphoryl diester phosphodiesterase (GDPDase)
MWYDEKSQKYKTSLIHKFFYVYTWPITKKLMFLLPSEFAHHRAINGIGLIYKIDKICSYIITIPIIIFILSLRLLSFLPSFSWKEEDIT